MNDRHTTPWLPARVLRAFPQVFLLLALAAEPAAAALVTVQGGTFALRYDDQIASVFGTPTIVGPQMNVIRFVPGASAIAFRAEGGQNMSGTIAFDIIPNDGYRVSGLSLMERGDYSLQDFDPNDGLAPPSVELGGTLRMTTFNSPLNEWVSLITSQTDLTVPGMNLPWQATAEIMTGATDHFDGTPWQGTTWGDYLTVTIQNELYSLVGDPDRDIASIEKKLLVAPFELEVVVPVPLPGGLALLVSGLGMLLVSRRRANRSSAAGNPAS